MYFCGQCDNLIFDVVILESETLSEVLLLDL